MPACTRARHGAVAALVTVLAARSLAGAPASAASCSMRGTPRADRLTGGWHPDRICALAGNDLLLGAAGNDASTAAPATTGRAAAAATTA